MKEEVLSPGYALNQQGFFFFFKWFERSVLFYLFI